MILLKCNRLCLSHMLSTPMASHLTEIKYSTLTRAPYHQPHFPPFSALSAPLQTHSFLISSMCSVCLPSQDLCTCCSLCHLIQASAQMTPVDRCPLYLKCHSVGGLSWALNLSLIILYFFFLRFIAIWHVGYIFAYCCFSH